MTPKNLRLCVVRRFLRVEVDRAGARIMHPDAARLAALEITEQLDVDLGAALRNAFKNLSAPIPIDQAMEIVDLYLKQRTPT